MPSVAQFLVERMENAGIRHVFGVPGDYILNLYKRINDYDGIDLVNTTNEANAGFAADAYARVHGIGCVCVTYNVGALNVANACAQAYAERSPVVILCGSPGIRERQEGLLLHHMVGSFDRQHKIFQNITCDSAVLDDPSTAGLEIDRVFESLNHFKQPVYIELPRDIADKALEYDVYKQGTPQSATSDPESLQEAIDEVHSWILASKNPVIMVGVEIARFALAEQLVKFAERHSIPMVTELLSKSTVGEQHPLFAGVYAGSSSREDVRELVEGSDCLVMCGVRVTDVTTGFMPSKFQKRQTVCATVEGLKIRNHNYENIVFSEFCNKLFKSDLKMRATTRFNKPVTQEKFEPQTGNPVTCKRLFECLESLVTKDHAIIADVGNSLFGAIDLTVHQSNNFISPAFYTSMGMAIPGSLGMHLAKPHLRPLVLVGDGAFQMTHSEISTLINRKLNPIIFVLNNRGYTTERFILEGSFNDIRDWNYHNIESMFGGGCGEKVHTEEELHAATKRALAYTIPAPYVINVVLDSSDAAPALERLTGGLKNNF